MLERRVYTEEFKRDAVRLAQERGNIRATAQDLGVSETVLSRWKRALTENSGNPFPGQGNPKDPELARLERENVRLREENAILKNSWRLCQRPQLKYQYIQQQRDKFSLAALCRAMRVSECQTAYKNGSPMNWAE